MDRLRHRLTLARRTWSRLAELSDRTSVSEIERDAAIQRFEVSFEAVWKASQLFLQERDARIALRMSDDRNLTAHAYNEDLAKRIFRDLSGYTSLIERWIDALEHRSPGEPSSGADL